MTISVALGLEAPSPSAGEGTNGGGSGKPEGPIKDSQSAHGNVQPPAAALSHARDAEDVEVLVYEDALAYAHILAYVSLAVKSSGLLALSLSTVILLGGYVQELGKKDFFCITVISAIQAAGIFKDFYNSADYLIDIVWTSFFLVEKILDSALCLPGILPRLLIPLLLVLIPLLVGIMEVDVVFMYGPLVCAAFSSWRIVELNHGNWDGTDSVADMMAAMNIFYSLIILQGAMFVVLFFVIIGIARRIMTRRLHDLGQLPREWGGLAIHTYLYDMSAKCRKDPLSTKGWTLIKHGGELLDSESQEDYLYGARLLSAFITKGKGEDVRRVLLPSTDRIQRLLDSLWIGRGGLDEDSREIRELAATIVADLAGDIDVGRYPGAMRCISSLIQHQEETTRTYRCISDPNPQRRRPMRPLAKGKQGEGDRVQVRQGNGSRWRLMRDKFEPRRPWNIEERRYRQKWEGGTSSNVVILQGLTILERLASNNDDNRNLICGTPGLLAKITKPVYSATLIQDVKTKACADIVTRCLKVLYQLIRSPDGKHEIFSHNVQALSNLKSILLELRNTNEAYHQELRLVAMKILTELALDLSVNLADEIKKVLVTEQLKLFLADGEGEECAAIAGRTMVSLSSNSKGNSALIMTTRDDTIGRLTGSILDDENNIRRRTIAAEIMANLCAHCTVGNMKEILSMVLREIMSDRRKSQPRKNSMDQQNPAIGDEEKQGNSGLRKCIFLIKKQISKRGDQTEIEEISDQEREKQEAFLSLAQVICDKLNSADLDDAIQSAVQNENNAGSEEQRREAFVDKLKTIIDDNRHPTADSLRIVKLCGRIAKSVMCCEQYVEIFRNKGFKNSLSEASETMSELESCMLLVGTDFGLKKTVRPLFSEIEMTWSQM